ncbi:13E12 repeat family protein [Aquihabitans sp. G128]|uniref:DUF222 domain-containing protein n=1 Tax=Aquihabitans sp. G128 TaxID=2849779 RepID=UPI001C21BFCC|nr:DUF222 domain-containing protein [Aquihabitans sp. G128]QXC63347.1 13E12 repeat family protein [Aquihabitans sp. G128]
MEAVVDREQAGALADLSRALDRLAAVGLDPLDAADARAVIGAVEVPARRLAALQVAVMGRIQERGLHRVDGHGSAKVLVRHVARLSDVEARRRWQVGRALRDLPVVAEAFGAGRVGVAQVERIARVWANPRVRSELVREDATAARCAAHESYAAFDERMTDFVRRVDQDGTADRSQASHANRTWSMHQDYDRGGWRGSFRMGSLEGAEVSAGMHALYEAELDADWAEARERLGDAATGEDLRRTTEQRWADAFTVNMRRGFAASAVGGVGAAITTNVVIDQDTFERYLRRLAGAADEQVAVDLDAAPGTPGARFRCSTIDGQPLDPSEVVAQALVGHLRRVVVGADGVVTDLGRRSRCFTGPAAIAVRLSSSRCYWPGCEVPASGCQIDHLTAWADRGDAGSGSGGGGSGGGGPGGGGATCPANGAPACGRHNRLKEHGFTVTRDAVGQFHVLRPDGTEIL